MPTVLFTTSTMPANDRDPVPGFVRDEAIWLNKLHPELKIAVLAPHNGYGDTISFSRHQHYDEYRFHYFWPFRLEKLTGRGIQPALKHNKWLVLELPGLFIAEFLATWRLARRLKPALLYAHWFTPQALTAAVVSKLTGIPLVFDTQASDVIVLKRLPFARALVAAVCRRAVAYTAPSRQTADKLLYFATDKTRAEMQGKLHLIPYGTAPSPPSKAVISQLRRKYGLKGKQVLYFIGRLVDRKGVDVLLKAFTPMSKHDPELHLLIIGDGQYRSNLEALARTLGIESAVTFTGYLTGQSKYDIIGVGDVGVLPSVNVGDQAEGLPIVFMEGVTASKVMVISDATGAHEIVRSGKNAFVAKAGSVDDLRAKLRQALKIVDKHDKTFYVAVSRLAETFQWPSIIARRHKVFQLDELSK